MNAAVETDPLRRRFLRRAGALMGGAFGASALAPLLLGAWPAQAADYKALVCVFLFGGNDGMNMIVPSDAGRHAQYAGVRGALALALAELVPLTGSSYGLHPAMAALRPFWEAGSMAPVFNVGPLNRPITKADYVNAAPGAEIVPDSLFSHSDQQLLWETGGSMTGERTGWGGRASAAMATVNPVISLGGNARFGVETLRTPLVLPEPGSVFGAYGLQPGDLGWEPNRRRKEALDALYAQPQALNLAQAFADQQRGAFEMSERLGAIVGSVPGDAQSVPAIDSAFAPLIAGGAISSEFARQMYQTAKLIAANAVVQGDRQLFFAQMGGFDTHEGQVGDRASSGHHAALLQELADGLAAFQRAMVNLGRDRSVTLFTQSDFGRTFAPNSTAGTDHAWGNHQFVLGGAVRGLQTYGTYPQLLLGGADDVGVESWDLQGRWIPTSSVDQYAATLLEWFGATPAQLSAALPNLSNFAGRSNLGFV